MVAQELIGILAGGKMEDTQLQLPLQGELFDLTNGSVGRTDASAICIEIENDALAVGAARQLRDLLAAQRCAQRGHSIGDTGGMESDHIEIPLHNNSTVLLPNGIGRLVETEKVLAFLKDLCFRGIEIFRFTAIKTASTEADHATLTVMDGDDDAMTKTVVEAGTHPCEGRQDQPLRDTRC